MSIGTYGEKLKLIFEVEEGTLGLPLATISVIFCWGVITFGLSIFGKHMKPTH